MWVIYVTTISLLFDAEVLPPNRRRNRALPITGVLPPNRRRNRALPITGVLPPNRRRNRALLLAL